MNNEDKNEALRKQMQQQEEELILKSRASELCRARSVTVGTGNGGVTEIMMRSANGYMWQILQPVEIIEFIHTLAGAVGCNVEVKPRKDFASWRNWKYSESELEFYREGGGALTNRKIASGWPPYANDIFPHASRALKMPPVEKQPGMPSEPQLGTSTPDIDINEIGKNATQETVHVRKEPVKKPITGSNKKEQYNNKENVNE